MSLTAAMGTVKAARARAMANRESVPAYPQEWEAMGVLLNRLNGAK